MNNPILSQGINTAKDTVSNEPSFVDLPVVCVVGLGYIGLPTAAVLADHGMRVHGVEVNPIARNTINQGRAHVVEPDLDLLVQSGVDSGRLEAFDSPGPADVFLLCVPTPVGGESGADLSYIRLATQAISPHLRAGNLVILESTSPPGTTELVAEIVQTETGLTSQQVSFAHAPERVLPGHILREVIHNDRVIGGINDQSTQAASEFYGLFVKGDILPCHCRVAETVKLVENASRDSQIAFANELSMLCHHLEISVWDVVKLANHHPRVNILRPGCGVGGHCIAVDPWFLINQAESTFGVDLPMMRTARSINEQKPLWICDLVLAEAKTLPLPTIACFGATYKPNIDDLRESPALKIIHELNRVYEGSVVAVEPHVSLIDGVDLVSCEEAMSRAEILVFLVPHQAFQSIEKCNLEGKRVVDACGLMELLECGKL